MSWRVANECADRIFGSAARKQIIMFLADKASDDGSGIWCSQPPLHLRLRGRPLPFSDDDMTTIRTFAGGLMCKPGFVMRRRKGSLLPSAGLSRRAWHRPRGVPCKLTQAARVAIINSRA